MPSIASSSARSAASRCCVASAASWSASEISRSAASIADDRVRIRNGRRARSSRRVSACGTVASRCATSASPRLRVAARWASPASTPVLSRYAAIACACGTGSCTGRQRERMVTSTSAGEGAVSSQIVCGGGSSIAFSSTLEVRSGMRSVSSSRITRQRLTEGRSWALRTSSRASSMLMLTASVRKCVKSAWEPFMTVTHPRQVPHPRSAGSGWSQSRVAAKTEAACRLSEPAPPVKSQACVGAWEEASCRSCAVTGSGARRVSHRLTVPPYLMRYSRAVVPAGQVAA